MYHLQNDLRNFQAIIDRDVKKSGLRLRGLMPPIKTLEQEDVEDAIILITAVDYFKSIVRDIPKST